MRKSSATVSLLLALSSVGSLSFLLGQLQSLDLHFDLAGEDDCYYC
ncbi:hypothetical protein [Hymenobacter elongatus]|nr:hypothetical protein [Hymenobacter elongatus]